MNQRVEQAKKNVWLHTQVTKDANDACKARCGRVRRFISNAESLLDGVIQASELKDDVMQLYFDGLKPGDKIGHYEFDGLSFPPS